MLNIRSITESFFLLEEELNIFEKQIDGVYFWELVRWHVHRQILEKKNIYGQAHTKVATNSNYYTNFILSAAKNLFIKNPFFAPQSDILFWGHQRRKKMGDGLWWDIYCDPIINYLRHEKSYLLLESPYIDTHLSPAKTAHLCYLDLVIFLAWIQRKLRIVRFFMSKKEQNLLKEIQKHIETRFKVNIDILPLVSNMLFIRKSILPFYKKVLKTIRPQIVVILCSYTGKDIFIGACKELAIPVVEMQHGTSVGRYHLGYSFPGTHGRKHTFPDYFFTFGDFWKNRSEYPIKAENIISVGYPFFELEIKKYAQVNKKEQILFISQGTIGKEMSKFATQLQARDDFLLDIAYKLHPGEYDRWKEEYPWLKNSKIIVIDDDTVPLYKLLAESSAQVGVYSTVVYEGLGFGLKTFLLDLPGIEYMEELISYKAATVVSSVDELVIQIQQPGEQEIEASSFFKPNALENISNTLNGIIRQSNEKHS